MPTTPKPPAARRRTPRPPRPPSRHPHIRLLPPLPFWYRTPGYSGDCQEVWNQKVEEHDAWLESLGFDPARTSIYDLIRRVK